MGFKKIIALYVFAALILAWAAVGAAKGATTPTMKVVPAPAFAKVFKKNFNAIMGEKYAIHLIACADVKHTATPTPEYMDCVIIANNFTKAAPKQIFCGEVEVDPALGRGRRTAAQGVLAGVNVPCAQIRAYAKLLVDKARGVTA